MERCQGNKEMEREAMFVLDASVVIKWFSKEKYTDIALKIRKGFSDGEYDIYYERVVNN